MSHSEGQNIVLPDKKIVSFIKKHHVLTLATCQNNIPWSCSCFYAVSEDPLQLIFSSSPETRHVKEFEKNEIVSVAIALETKIIGKLQGVQMSGKIIVDTQGLQLSKAYLKRFPYASVMDLNLWAFEPEFIKFTDNTLGFGKKLTWQKG
ncbi:MAG TPA: pyridoxamine 5'-phosphate oxidase family protein [Bacteroidales bacterium]|nr:pyridoxamine 5'-phosphate oxidase family protein [Bacteroidales bacterium]